MIGFLASERLRLAPFVRFYGVEQQPGRSTCGHLPKFPARTILTQDFSTCLRPPGGQVLKIEDDHPPYRGCARIIPFTMP